MESEQPISNAEMVERYWDLLPAHIQQAIDAKGLEHMKRIDRMTSGMMLGSLTDTQILQRARMSRVLQGLRSLHELPSELKQQQRRRLEEDATNYRASMLAGNDIMDLKRNNSPFPGIDLLIPADAAKEVLAMFRKAGMSIEGISVGNAVKLQLPRGAYNVNMGGIGIYGDYEGKWTGNEHHYGSHYDEATKTYYEAKGCQDCDRGPDLRNAKLAGTLEHKLVVGIQGYQPPETSRYDQRLPVFYQNPNFFPDGTRKAGSWRPVFYERLCAA